MRVGVRPALGFPLQLIQLRTTSTNKALEGDESMTSSPYEKEMWGFNALTRVLTLLRQTLTVFALHCSRV